MEDVLHWLNNSRNYQAGVELYLKYGRDKLLKTLFTAEAESEFKRTRLVKALKELYNNFQHPTSPKAAIQRQLEKQDPTENFKYWPPIPIADPVLAALYESWRPIYAEMMNLQARIYEVAQLGNSDPAKAMEASEMVHRILDLDDACDEIYAKRDHYYQHGTLPANVQNHEPVGDPVKMAVELNNSLRYIREYKAKLKKDPANVKAAEKLLKHENRVKELRIALKMDHA